jgi:tungstate transport system permease protein
MADTISQAFEEAIRLIFSGDPEVFAVVSRSIYASGFGVLLACLWGIPIGIVIGLYSFKGRWIIKGLFHAFIGIPTVALGLLLYLFLSKQGTFGFLHILYTVNGIAVGQAILITPIIVTFTSSALAASDVSIRDLARTLGASNIKTNLTIMRETVWSITLAVVAAFSRAFGELGIAMIVGGNIFQQTRVLTTSIAVETTLGQFPTAIAYGILLITIVIAITMTINLVEKLKEDEISWKRPRFWKSKLID